MELQNIKDHRTLLQPFFNDVSEIKPVVLLGLAYK